MKCIKSQRTVYSLQLFHYNVYLLRLAREGLKSVSGKDVLSSGHKAVQDHLNTGQFPLKKGRRATFRMAVLQGGMTTKSQRQTWTQENKKIRDCFEVSNLVLWSLCFTLRVVFKGHSVDLIP